MIKVTPMPEYPGFDTEVRQRGAAFLATCPTPTSGQFKNRQYWARATKELHKTYRGICSYTAMYLLEQGTVDHFLPKTTYPQLAYEWSNFRLASWRVNSAKGHKTNILDPFSIEDDWFQMDIPTCLIRANPILEQRVRSQVSETISSLGLNSDDNYVQERCDILIYYARGNIDLAFVKRRYPFLAKELERQRLGQNELRALFKVD
ncbi:MAG: hypothetical protein IPM54_31125 [Polyangiaceae bacterium]|nr:hypothetical protein [Polyangiaceae bacterium]